MLKMHILGRQVPLDFCHWSEAGRNPTHKDKFPYRIPQPWTCCKAVILTGEGYNSIRSCLFPLLVYCLPNSWHLASFPGHWAWFYLIFVYCYYLQHPSFFFWSRCLKIVLLYTYYIELVKDIPLLKSKHLYKHIMATLFGYNHGLIPSWHWCFEGL
jgi:hypothetical protein